MISYDETVDLDEIRVQELDVRQGRDCIEVTLVGTNLGDVLDSIGEDKVREYFSIPEGE